MAAAKALFNQEATGASANVKGVKIIIKAAMRPALYCYEYIIIFVVGVLLLELSFYLIFIFISIFSISFHLHARNVTRVGIEICVRVSMYASECN